MYGGNRSNVADNAARAFVNLENFTGYATTVRLLGMNAEGASVVEYTHHWTLLATAYATANGGVNYVFTDCGGYRSVTTKARINAILREFGFYLTSENGTWFVGSQLHNEEIPFRAGLSLETLRELNRTIRTEQRERKENESAQRALSLALEIQGA